eukprot:TRINITY_DN13875_c0_g1_i1.p1 TRINITY_DN13875_c0_g1~~TRINITY_DN13875_c0_g1_i1.p1  ORF type:complete len:301 (+),score=43.51 TRINITY_DN13875_c0_g1_i1:2-904(+)
MAEERKPKTHKGKLHLQKREPKIEEDPKTAIFIRGHKTSEAVGNLLKDLLKLRDFQNVNLLKKKHQIRPFEDPTQIEFLCEKNNASLFAFGNHIKKRPDNLILGRTFDSRILEMLEFGVSDYIPIDHHEKPSVAIPGQKPVILFQGTPFEYSDNLIKAKNMLADFFKLYDVKQANILETRRLLVFTAIDEKSIRISHYETQKPAQDMEEGKFEMKELGPSCNLTIRRTQLPSNDLYKSATVKPKVKKTTAQAKKNIITNALSQTKGRIHISQQDLKTLNLHKPKKMKHKEMEYMPFEEDN